MKSIDNESSKLKLVLNIIVLGISLYGVSVKDFKEGEISFFQGMVIHTVAPIQQTVTFFRNRVSLMIDNYVLLMNADVENGILTKKVKNLENTIFQLQQLKAENIRLKDLLKFGEDIPREKVLAQIIGWDATTSFKVLRINKGEKDGIKLKSAVVTVDGLVGYVYRMAAHYSDIMTILDQNNRVDAIVDRTRSHGIIQGLSTHSCIMKYVTRTEPVVLGDQVLTSGLGIIYPKGLRLGMISKIERESYGITQLIEITPSVDFQKIEEVIVLISQEVEGEKLKSVIAENKKKELEDLDFKAKQQAAASDAAANAVPATNNSNVNANKVTSTAELNGSVAPTAPGVTPSKTLPVPAQAVKGKALPVSATAAVKNVPTKNVKEKTEQTTTQTQATKVKKP